MRKIKIKDEQRLLLSVFFIERKYTMEQKKIDRINELARKSKTAEGLTDEEKAEQAQLRQEFRDAVKRNLTSQLDNIEFVDKPKK